MEAAQSFINNAVLICVLLLLIPFMGVIGFIIWKFVRFIINRFGI